MSLLGTQVYANPTTPCWVSASGDVINGDLTVTGTLTAEGPVKIDNGVIGIEFNSATGVGPGMTMYADATGTNGNIESDGSIYLGRIGAGATANSQYISGAAGTDTDTLSIGGTVEATVLFAGPSVTPLSLITTTRSINPVPVSPAPQANFIVDTNYPTVSGQEYDIQARGVIAVAAGAPDVSDTVGLVVHAGGGATWGYTFFPSAVGASNSWQFRDRIVSQGSSPTIFISVSSTQAGASTATYAVNLIQADVTRVK